MFHKSYKALGLELGDQNLGTRTWDCPWIPKLWSLRAPAQALLNVLYYSKWLSGFSIEMFDTLLVTLF